MTTERMNELFNGNETLAICVGSWKAYTECNKHSLGTYYNGSFYIDFTLLESEEELYEVLDFLGWSKLEQEELFIQDYCSTCGIKFKNCDNINPASIINAIVDNNIDLDEDLDKIGAIMEYTGDDFSDACNEIDNYNFYPNKTAEEYVREIDEDFFEQTLEKAGFGYLSAYITIDWEQIAKDDCYLYESHNGLLVIL